MTSIVATPLSPVKDKNGKKIGKKIAIASPVGG